MGVDAEPESSTACRLSQESSRLRDFLLVGACLGMEFDVDKLNDILGKDRSNIIAECARKGYLTTTGEDNHRRVVFVDQITWESVYNIVPDNQRGEWHVRIGRHLWKEDLLEGSDNEARMEVLSHMRLGKEWIQQENERFGLARLCLVTGRVAAADSNFRSASEQLQFGIDLLGVNGWERQYDLTLAIYNAAMEMALCIGDYSAMSDLIDITLQKASSFLDQIPAYRTKVYVVGAQGDPQRAIDLGMELLSRLGQPLGSRFRMLSLVKETLAVRRLLRKRSNQQLLQMPNMKDPQILACMAILNVTLIYSMSARPSLLPFICLRFVELTITHGLCLLSPQAFACYGIFLSGSRDYDNAYRFGKFALELIEYLNVPQSIPRVYAAHYGVLHALKEPACLVLDKLLKGYEVGLETGDYEFACFNANIHCHYSLQGNISLVELDQNWSRVRERTKSLKQYYLLLRSTPCMQAVRHYMGETDDPLAAEGDMLNFDKLQNFSDENNLDLISSSVSFHRLMIAYVFNAYDEAYTHLEGARKLLEASSPIDESWGAFMCALAELAYASRHSKLRREANRNARKSLKILRRLSLSCPANFGAQKNLVEAELAALLGKKPRAMENYANAVALANYNGMLLVEALANERGGRFLLSLGDLCESERYLRSACDCYRKWGAKAKLDRLTSEVESIFASKSKET